MPERRPEEPKKEPNTGHSLPPPETEQEPPVPKHEDIRSSPSVPSGVPRTPEFFGVSGSIR